MIRKPAAALLFAVLYFPGNSVAEDPPSIAEQSLRQLKTNYHYAPPAAGKSATSASPILAAPATADAVAVAAMAPIQLPAFTVVESLRAHDLTTAMRAADQKLKDEKFSIFRASELWGTDLGPVRTSVRFETEQGHGPTIDFNILRLSW